VIASVLSEAVLQDCWMALSCLRRHFWQRAALQRSRGNLVLNLLQEASEV
jgi:hypothetical protein